MAGAHKDTKMTIMLIECYTGLYWKCESYGVPVKSLHLKQLHLISSLSHLLARTTHEEQRKESARGLANLVVANLVCIN